MVFYSSTIRQSNSGVLSYSYFQSPVTFLSTNRAGLGGNATFTKFHLQ